MFRKENARYILFSSSYLSKKFLIDSDYTGPLFLSLYNRTDDPIRVEPGERVAQAMLIEKTQCMFMVVDEFSGTTERGEGAFGHTGKF